MKFPPTTYVATLSLPLLFHGPLLCEDQEETPPQQRVLAVDWYRMSLSVSCLKEPRANNLWTLDGRAAGGVYPVRPFCVGEVTVGLC